MGLIKQFLQLYRTQQWRSQHMFVRCVRVPCKIVPAGTSPGSTHAHALASVNETILFLVRCGIAFRAGRDIVRVFRQNAADNMIYDEGNSRFMPQFKATSGNAAMADHLETAPADAMFVSPPILSRLVDIIGKIILRHVVKLQQNHEVGYPIIV